MKKCKKCGALQNDDNSTCIDCGAVLGKALSEAEEAEINENLDDKLEGMSERTEDFYVPLRDKIMGVLSAIGIVAAIILLVLVGRENDRINAEIPDGVIVDRGSDGQFPAPAADFGNDRGRSFRRSVHGSGAGGFLS